MCGDWHHAEDIVQATFIWLYQRRNRVRPDTADACTRKILTNVFLSGLPKRHREQAAESIPDSVAPQGRDSTERLDVASHFVICRPNSGRRSSFDSWRTGATELPLVW